MPYTKAAQNASTLGDVFDLGELIATSVTFANTASSTATITHGLTGTPDWVLWSANDIVPAIALGTVNTTSITFTRTATTTSGAARIDVLYGDKS